MEFLWFTDLPPEGEDLEEKKNHLFTFRNNDSMNSIKVRDYFRSTQINWDFKNKTEIKEMYYILFAEIQTK